jgi:glycosyltransferase involved in cell wall biosynthesis
MISVLIPVYNVDVRELVANLYQQLLDCNVTAEIICLDDASTSATTTINRQLPEIASSSQSAPVRIRYEELPENIGRARIRNALAARAQYPFLLFMDCDSKVVRSDFMQVYLTHLQHDTLVCGGGSYASQRPADPKRYLHWHYGRQREQLSVAQRQLRPYDAFKTYNFLIPKAIFDQIRFDEQIRSYGHEDTLFGMELQQRNINILHIDNPLEHIGLEINTVFLEKTKQSIHNLLLLRARYATIKTKLLHVADLLLKYRITNLVYHILRYMHPWMLRHLLGPSPQLYVLDCYKLLLLLDARSSLS